MLSLMFFDRAVCRLVPMMAVGALGLVPSRAHAQPEPEPGAPPASRPAARSRAPSTSASIPAGEVARGTERYPDYILSLPGHFLASSYLYAATAVEASEQTDGGIIFGAEPALYLPIFSDLRDQAGKLARGWATAHTALLSFQVQLRMYDAKSQPIFGPGYRPELQYRLFGLRRSPGEALLLMTKLGIGHYSNGQGGCAWDLGAGADQPPDCKLPPEGRRLETLVDRDRGSFGNVVHLFGGFGMDWMQLDGGRVESSLSVEAQAAYHVFSPEELSKYYGAVQGTLTLTAMQHASLPWLGGAYYRQQLQGQLALARERRGREAPQSRLRLEAALHVQQLRGLGVFVAGVVGRDPYNIRFVDHIEQLQVGLAYLAGLPVAFPE